MSILAETATRNPFIDAARAYLARGWRPIPLRPGSKAPACPDWPSLRLDEAGAVETWTAEPTPGIGLLCGEPSALVVLDFDAPAAFSAWRAEHPEVTTRVVTRDGAPEGRAHLYFALAPGQAAPPSTKGPGWDLLSTGRQVCAPPTRHPSGGLYRVTVDAPLAAWRPEYTPARPAPAEPTLHTTAGTAGRELAWGDTIGPAAGTDPAPGYARAALDSEAAAVAAATPGTRNDRLNVAALKLGQIVAAGLLTLPEVEAALIEAAGAAGLPEAEARATVASGLRKGQTEPRAVTPRATPRAPAGAPTLTSAEPPAAAPEPWTDPAPLDGGGAGVLDPWPWETLPEPLRAMGQAIAEARNTPDAMAGAVVLGAAGAALGNRLALTIKEGHTVRANLYWMVAAGVGVGKTPALRPALAPLVDWEAAQRPLWLDAIRHWRARADLAEARRGAVKRDGAKAGADLDRLQHDLAAIEAELGPEPPEPRLFAEDCTSEALGRRLAGNAERMAVVSSEGRKVLQIARGRYTDGKAGDLDLWLKGHAGDPHRVDRQGRPPYDLHAPCLSALLTVQPDALQSIGQDPEARASGFLARFLYV
ncbi:MAG: DUF3987 domain-containing protein, partial [Chloroflexi bacterium]|nr:DUF3987 domain-containing protein [Chloroflexota bacterium]